MMTTVIDEPLICHTICEYLKLYEVDKLRRVNRAFLEAGNHILRDVNVLATCGLYTIGSSYYAGALETIKHKFYLEEEHESYYKFMYKTVECFFIKNNVDHILLGGYIGIMKHDHIEILHVNFSQNTLDDTPYRQNDCWNDIIFLDNATKGCIVNKDVPLRSSIFHEAILMRDLDVSCFGHDEYVFSKVDDSIVVKSDIGFTIQEIIDVFRLGYGSRITFDGRVVIN